MNWNNNSNLSSKTDIKSTNRRRKSCYVVVATLARWGIVLSFQAHTSLPFLPGQTNGWEQVTNAA